MNREEITNKLNDIFHEVFDNESIVVIDSLTAENVDGWDSLTHITLMGTIEDEFDIKFAMKDIIGLKNVGELINLIESKLS